VTFTASLVDIVERNENGLLSAHSAWRRVPLAQVAQILNGFPFPSAQFTKEVGTPLLRIRDILNSETETYFDGEYDPDFLIQSGDLVVGMDGDFNSTIWRGRQSLLNQRVCKLSPNEQFYRKKLLAYVLPGYLRAINAETSSVTVKHLSSNTVAEIPLPLPALPEQDRIVEEIEKQFTRLDAAVAALKRVQSNLKRYRAAVLKAACEGRLVPTEAELARREGRSYEPASVLLERILAERRAGWEGPPTKYRSPKPPNPVATSKLPDGWAWATLSQISWNAGYGTSKKCEYEWHGPPVLRIPNVASGKIDLSDLKRARESTDLNDFDALSVGDMLIVRTNGSRDLIGRSAVIEKPLPKPYFYASYLIRYRLLDETALLAWIRTTWDNPSNRQRIERLAATTAGQYNVSVSKLDGLEIPIPPAREMQRIATEIDRRTSVIDELEAQVRSNLLRAERLRQSILKRAFEGKLVPQDPNDEAASILLERIRRAKSAETVVHSTKRKAASSPRKATTRV
jgi:type I restriction enzyme, S subunit